MKTREKCWFVCNFCYHVFTRMISMNTLEVKCPKCKESDCDIFTSQGEADRAAVGIKQYYQAGE